MKRLSRWVWTSVAILMIATTPHAVGASLPASVKVKDMACLSPALSLWQSKVMAKAEGKKQAMAEWNSKYEWHSLYTLWMQESKWDYTADNKDSTAFGIPQILDMPTDTSIIEQIQLGIKYIKSRYGTPSRALAFHNVNGWY